MKSFGIWDSSYFEWLYIQVGCDPGEKDHSLSYFMLIEQLNQIRARWSVVNDDNRIQDGLALRRIFIEEVLPEEADESPIDTTEGCSFLEFVLGVSYRLAYETHQSDDEWTVENWFWILMRNCGLKKYCDSEYLNNEFAQSEVEDIVNRILDRDYDSDGNGGLFPLRNPFGDQRKIEVWYQMASYILETVPL